MKKAFVIAIAAIVLSGCNTISGIGRDVQKAGQVITGAGAGGSIRLEAAPRTVLSAGSGGGVGDIAPHSIPPSRPPARASPAFPKRPHGAVCDPDHFGLLVSRFQVIDRSRPDASFVVIVIRL